MLKVYGPKVCKRCQCSQFLWAVMNPDGVRAWFADEADAAKELALLAKHTPDDLFWVAPWPARLAGEYPQTPWAEMPQFGCA